MMALAPKCPLVDEAAFRQGKAEEGCRVGQKRRPRAYGVTYAPKPAFA
jgi:hypothetical protein